MTDFQRILEVLGRNHVNHIIVGGYAASIHGSARFTSDLDVVYERTAENITRVVDALSPIQPYLRGAPPGLPFRFEAQTIRNGLNFTLTTLHGDLDILGEIAGGGGYAQLAPFAEKVELFGQPCLVLGLEKLIHVKRAAGRPKDLESIAELEAIREELDGPE